MRYGSEAEPGSAAGSTSSVDDLAEIVRPHIRSWRINPRHALAAAALCWALFGLIVMLALTGRTVAVDALGLQLWRTGPDLAPRGPRWLLEAIRDLTAMGGILLRHLCVIGALTALLFLRLQREALVLAWTVLGGWLLNSAMKYLVARERPTIVPHLTEASGNSFPSGHSFNSAVVFLAIALAFAAMSARRSVRWTIIGSAIGLTWAISCSRVWLGVHFPSDVIAGWLGGAGWAFMAAALLDRPAREILDR
jgi:undecaprenyl-diphosphatase